MSNMTLLLVLALLGLAKSEWALSDYLQACSHANVTLYLGPKSSHMMTIPDEDTGEPVLFMRSTPDYPARCISADPEQQLQISLRSMPRAKNDHLMYYKKQDAFLEMDENRMIHVNAINRMQTRVICHGPDRLELCAAHVLVVDQLPTTCNATAGHVECHVVPLLQQIQSSRTGQSAYHRFGGGNKSEPLAKTTHFDLYDADAGDWVRCDETDREGVGIGVSTHTENKTAWINCPFELIPGVRSAMIRIVETQRTHFGVGIPVLNMPEQQQQEMTFFNVDLNFLVPQQEFVGGNGNNGGNRIAIVLGVIVGVILIVIVYFVLRRFLTKERGLYAGMKIGLSGDPEQARGTDEALLYTRIINFLLNEHNLLSEFKHEDLNQPLSEISKEKFVQLLEKTLSGEPDKLNPELTMNEQARILSYNSKLEIGRANFTIGHLLGSGQFGSVFLGQAKGVLHPEASTDVAIKTVNNQIDFAQFTALLCEMKMLTNLDLHFNLVNLLGSCTEEIEDCRLWLLLEYCDHGDLKSFLLNNKYQLKNSIEGRVATDLDHRIFVNWAHSIAKGMEYLSSKKILHGDLAARNILLGEGLVAKVSDFGLSKSLYNDEKYKRENRTYVPWKWMALEYLENGVLNLSSDVWSYGVVLWEMLSLGREPYMEKDHKEMIDHIKKGHRLKLPEEADEVDFAPVLFNRIMRPSWTAEPKERVSFEEIVGRIESVMTLEEKAEYETQSSKYLEERELMLAGRMAPKISSPKATQPQEPPPPFGTYQQVCFGPTTSLVINTADSGPPVLQHANGYIALRQLTEQPAPAETTNTALSVREGYSRFAAETTNTTYNCATETVSTPHTSQRKAKEQSATGPYTTLSQIKEEQKKKADGGAERELE